MGLLTANQLYERIAFDESFPARDLLLPAAQTLRDIHRRYGFPNPADLAKRFENGPKWLERPPATAVAAPPPSTPDAGNVSRSCPQRVLLVGSSSIASALGIALERKLEAEWETRVTRASELGSGLTRRERYDWQQTLKRMQQRRRPDLTIVALGANDTRPIDDGRRLHRLRSPAWRSEYERRVSAIIKTTVRLGGELVWLGPATVRSANQTRSLMRVHDVLREKCQGACTFVPMMDIATSETGDYQEHLMIDGTLQAVHTDDGKHFNREGARLAASIVYSRLVMALGLEHCGRAEFTRR
ncbi:MAG: hypothetical protein AAFP04_05920 [Myxococcota bacterium]